MANVYRRPPVTSPDGSRLFTLSTVMCCVPSASEVNTDAYGKCRVSTSRTKPSSTRVKRTNVGVRSFVGFFAGIERLAAEVLDADVADYVGQRCTCGSCRRPTA